MRKIEIIMLCIRAPFFIIVTLLSALGIGLLLTVDIQEIYGLPRKTIWTLVAITTFLILFTATYNYIKLKGRIQELERKLDDQKEMQKKVDRLAELRSEGINQIYAGTPTPENFDSWKKKYESWKRKVEKHLTENFTYSVIEMFTDLGMITTINFLHASKHPKISNKHTHCLRMLTKELGIIERLIQENTRLTPIENKETFLELIGRQEQI